MVDVVPRRHRGISLLTQYVQFCMIGATNLGVDLAVYWTLTRHIAFFSHYQVTAHMISFTVAVVNSYIWNTLWVFRAGKARNRKEEALRFSKFVIVQAGGLLISSGCFLLLTTHFYPTTTLYHVGPAMARGDIIAKLITSVVISLWNFPANKLWIFRK